MTPFDRLVIPGPVRDAVTAHARDAFPNECCGVLAGTTAGRVATAAAAFPVGNDLASPTGYATNARDLLTASKAIRAAGWEWLAVYHSHPSSPPVPSRTDLAENTYGESVAHVIVGLAGGEAEVRAWWLGATNYRSVGLDVA